MCRLYGFRASAPTRVECSLVLSQNALLIQSRSDSRGMSHPDGWGIAYYSNGRPNIERRDTAAFDDLYFSSTAERVYSNTVVAHIRKATVGEGALRNTHPFSFGSWVFAHNGTITGFEEVRGTIEDKTDPYLLSRCQGDTDSETTFFWILSELKKVGMLEGEVEIDLGELTRIMIDTVQCLAARCAQLESAKKPELNFLLTNGEVLLASRWNHTLYSVFRQGVHDCEICGIPHTERGDLSDYRALVVASEPISQEEWQPVPEGHLLVVDRSFEHQLVPI